jgi:hypothetical protein
MAAGASDRAPVPAGRVLAALAGVRVGPAAYPAVRHPHHGSRVAQQPGKRTAAWLRQPHKQHSRNENHGGGQQHPYDHEQRAGNEEYGPPVGQHYPYEPPDRPRACDARGPRSTVPIGWDRGRTPHNQVPAMGPHSHHGLLSRRKASGLLLGVYLNSTLLGRPVGRRGDGRLRPEASPRTPWGWGAVPQQPPQARRDLTSLRPGSLFSFAETRQGDLHPHRGTGPASLTITTRPTRLAWVHKL